MRLMVVVAGFLALAGCQSFQEDWNRAFGRPSAAAEPPSTTAQTADPQSVTTTSSSVRGPEQDLLDAERRLATAAQAAGLGGALAAVLDVDALVVRPGAVYTTPEAVERGLGAPTAGPVFWQPDRVHVSQSGDMGMTSGRYVQVVPGAEALQGRYIIVWRKNAAGEWRALSETRTPDPARPAPARRRR